MQRFLRHHPLSALWAFLSLIAAAILPFGSVASAQSPTLCQSNEFFNCTLGISAPESVPVGEPFTVSVTLLQYGNCDGNCTIPLPKSDFCASKTVVSLNVYQGEGPGTTYSSKVKAGVARFNVSVPAGGHWSLDAYVAHGEGNPNCGYFDDGNAELMAVVIPVGQPIAPCPDNLTCVQTASGTGSAATLIADEGTTFTPLFGDNYFSSFAESGLAPPSSDFSSFAASALSRRANGCDTPADPDGGVLGFLHEGGGSKTIVFALRSDLVTKGIGRYNICWQSDLQFKQRDGTLAPLDGTSTCGPTLDHQDQPCYRGILPNCKKKDPAKNPGPCVLFRSRGQHNIGYVDDDDGPGDDLRGHSGYFGVRAPPGDPKAYPF